MSTTTKGVITLLAAAIIEMEFVPEADVFQVAKYLRTIGMPTAIVDPATEKILIQPESYNNTMNKLVMLMPNLPEVSKLNWKEGRGIATIYESSSWESEVVPSSACFSIFK